MSKWLRFVVSGVLLTWIGCKTDWPEVGRSFANLRVGYWLAAVGVLVGTQVVSAWRWRLFSQALRFDASVASLSSYYFIGMYFNLLLPTSVGGDVVRAWYLNGTQKRKLAAFASVLLDRVNGLSVLIVLAAAAAACSPLELPGWIWFSVLGILGAAVFGTLGLFVVARSGKLPRARAEQLRTMLDLMHSPRIVVHASALSLFVQLANVAIVWLVTLGLSLDVPFGYLAILVPMVSLLTLLPTVNGTGVREWGTALFLAPLGISETPALTLAFLWLSVHLAVSVLGGLVYVFGHYAKPETPAGSPGDEVDDGPVDRHSDQGRAGQLKKAA